MKINWLLFSCFALGMALIFYISIFMYIFSFKMRSIFDDIFMLSSYGKNKKIASLDTVRGLAAVIVAMAHFWNFATPIFNNTQTEWFWSLAVAGNKAVVIFVILSGFLIYRTVKKIETMEDMLTYLKRRFLRIYPVYFFTTCLAFFFKESPLDIANVLSNILMIRSISPVYIKISNPPAWSLYVEILFYMLMPIWVLVCKKNIILWGAITFTVFMLIDSQSSREMWLLKYFFSGIIVSELVDKKDSNIKEWTLFIIFTIGIFLLLLDFKVTQQGAFCDWFNMLGLVPKNKAEYTIGLALSIMLIFFALAKSKNLSQLFNIKFGRFLGSISYSLYLTHPFFLLFVFHRFSFSLAGTPQHLLDANVIAPVWYLPFVMLPGAVVLASLCFVFVERPFLILRNKKRSTRTCMNMILPLRKIRIY